MKINFKKLGKTLTEFANSSSYDKPAMLRVEHTAFQPLHKVSRGRNGVSELLELHTRVIEANGILIQPSERSSYVTVYVSSPVKTSHGFGSNRGSFVRVRDPKGKYHSFETFTAWELEDVRINGMINSLGSEAPATYAPDEFKEYLDAERESVVKLADRESPELSSWEIDRIRRQFAEKFYRELVKYDLDDARLERFEKFLDASGFKLVTYFNFTDKFSMIPEYFDETSQGFEIGWTQTDTYNSLPQTLKVIKSRDIKTVSLAEIGIEGRGYHSHDDRMQILPEQAEKAKKFAARFRAKKNKVTEKVLSAVIDKAA